MRRTSAIYLLLILSLPMLGMLTACHVSKLSEKLGRDINKKADSAGRNLIIGIQSQLSDPKTKKDVIALLQSIITSLDSTIEPKITSTVGRVISPKVILWTDSLVESLTGEKIQKNAKLIQYNLVGRTKKDIVEIRDAFRELLEYIVSDETNAHIGNLRDQILGAKTDTAISRLIDHATKKLFNNLEKPFQNQVHTLSGTVITIMIIAGLIILTIIFAIWWSRRQYQRMAVLLTKHINDIPDRHVYDHTTKQIQSDAIATGIEPALRKVLQANGLLNTNSWHEKKTLESGG